MAGTAVVAWHLTEAQRFFATVALPPELVNTEKLEAWIIGRCHEKGLKALSTREIQQFGPNAIRRKEPLEEALEALEKNGRIRQEAKGRQKLIRVHPALLRS